MAKLTKMQINRLDQQLNDKINKLTSEEFFPVICEKAFIKEKKKCEAIKSTILAQMAQMLVLKYTHVSGNKVTSTVGNYIGYLGTAIVFEMVYGKKHELLAEYFFAKTKYDKILDDHKAVCTDREDRIKSLRNGLETIKEEILNAAYFKDAQFALDALESFGV